MEMCTPRHPPLQPTTKHHRRDPCTAPHAAEGTQPRQARTRCPAATTTRTPPPHRPGVATPASSSVFTARDPARSSWPAPASTMARLAQAEPRSGPPESASRSAPGCRRASLPQPPSSPLPDHLPAQAPAVGTRRAAAIRRRGFPNPREASAAQRRNSSCHHRLRAGFTRRSPPATAGEEVVVCVVVAGAIFSAARVAQGRERRGGLRRNGLYDVVCSVF
jgi:hypothetical protein